MLNKSMSGVTLLEIMLVLVIAAVIIVLGFQQFNIYRHDAEVRQIQSNVNILFQAMAKYFRAHCHDPGTFAQSNSQNISIDLSDLQDQKFLVDTLAANSIVDNSIPDEAYALQFNQMQTAQGNLPQRLVYLTQTTQQSIGQVIVWKAQVAAKLSDPNTAIQYQALLGADCLSNGSGANVTPCENAPSGSSQYAVWERMPSFTASRINSPYWLTMPTVRQFTQMYTTYPILLLLSADKWAQQQFFVCGS